MKDKMPGSSVHNLAPCPLSIHCLRLLDEIEGPASLHQVEMLYEEDKRELQLVEQLRAHVPTCPTCAAALERAHRMRAQQRRLLRDVLTEGEQMVPSTTVQIMSAVRRKHVDIHNHQRQQRAALAPVQPGDRRPARLASRRMRTVLGSLCSLVAVAVIMLASFGLFGRLALRHTAISSPASRPSTPVTLSGNPLMTPPAPTPQPQPASVQPFSDWHRVLLTESDPDAGWLRIDNISALDGSNSSLSGGTIPATTRVDGVSPDGKNILYQALKGDRMVYFTLAQPGQGVAFYTLNSDEAGNAIWLSDSRTVFISTIHNGVLKVDTQTHAAQLLLPSLTVGTLTFYHAPFLYFIGSENLATAALYRVNIGNGALQQVTMRSPGSTFWLSPDGSTIYYVNKGAAGQPGIYAVNSDGSNSRIVSADGVPIGYAADMALMIVRQEGNAFQVVKPGMAGSPDQMVLKDVAPGAVSLCDSSVPAGVVPICDSSIALAPLGGSLLVEAGYADGSHKLWSINLQTGQRLQASGVTAQAGVQVRLIGWDRIPPAA
jgi:hypothetical protein